MKQPAAWFTCLLSLVFCFIGMFAFNSAALAVDRSIQKDYPLTKLSNNVYVIHGPNTDVSKENQGFRNNPVIVTTQAGVVIIDPGSSAYTGEMIINKAKTVSDKPVIAVFNTHGHGDHWLGNHGIRKHFPKATIYAHPLMKARLEAGDADMWVGAMSKRTEGMTDGTKAVLPDRVVNNGDKVQLGGITLRIHHNGKAHSTNDIMIDILEEKVFVFGDNLRNENLSMFMESFSGNLAALEIGHMSKATVFVPGHGQSGDRKIIDKYRDFILALKKEVKKHYEAGLSDFEMKPKIVNSLARQKGWTGFEENIGRLVNLAYLEVESEAFE